MIRKFHIDRWTDSAAKKHEGEKKMTEGNLPEIFKKWVSTKFASEHRTNTRRTILDVLHTITPEDGKEICSFYTLVMPRVGSLGTVMTAPIGYPEKNIFFPGEVESLPSKELHQCVAVHFAEALALHRGVSSERNILNPEIDGILRGWNLPVPNRTGAVAEKATA